LALLDEIDDRRLDLIDGDVSDVVAATGLRRDHPVPGPEGRRAIRVRGPENGDYRGPKTRCELHRSRVVSHEHSETRRDRRETGNIGTVPEHRKLDLRGSAELFGNRFLARPDHDHRFEPLRTQPGGELTEEPSRPALCVSSCG
jgi:hypothetical protein